MANAFALLIPALIPSWEFFKAIEPSPRVQWQVMKSPQAAENWQEFRPRPCCVSALEILKRLVWNPGWNESLYMVSLSERLITTPTQHSIDEIFRRLALETTLQNSRLYICFRLVFRSYDGAGITDEILYTSEIRRLQDITV